MKNGKRLVVVFVIVVIPSVCLAFCLFFFDVRSVRLASVGNRFGGQTSRQEYGSSAAKRGGTYRDFRSKKSC